MRQIITCLDAGSSKVKVVVSEIYKNKLHVLACSEVKSKGIKKGVVVNPEEARDCIQKALDKVEGILNIKIDKIICLVPAYYAEYLISEGVSTITNEEKIVTGEDILRTYQACVYNRFSQNKELVSIMPIEFWLNETVCIKDPKGKPANKMSCKSVLVVAPKKNTYTIVSVLESLKIEVLDICFGFIGDFYTYKKPEFDTCNIALINIGAEKTEIGIFRNAIATGSAVVQSGGKNIDRDISYIYDIPIKDSHRLKEKFACSSPRDANMNETEVVLTKNDESIKINQYEVSEIVYSRIKEILEECKKQINSLTKKEISYIIVTGGTSELVGFEETAKEILGKKVVVPSIYEMGVRNNKFSSVIGFTKYYYEKLNFRNKVATTMNEADEEEMFNKKKKVKTDNILGKIYGYFFDN